MTDVKYCANYKAPLPLDQPTGQHYCAKCAAHWQQGQVAIARREPSTH